MPTIKEMFGGIRQMTPADVNKRVHNSVNNWHVGGMITKDSFKNTTPNTSQTSNEELTASSNPRRILKDPEVGMYELLKRLDEEAELRARQNNTGKPEKAPVFER